MFGQGRFFGDIRVDFVMRRRSQLREDLGVAGVVDVSFEGIWSCVFEDRKKVCVIGRQRVSGRGIWSKVELVGRQVGRQGQIIQSLESAFSFLYLIFRVVGSYWRVISKGVIYQIYFFLRLCCLLCGKQMLVGKKWKEGYQL